MARPEPLIRLLGTTARQLVNRRNPCFQEIKLTKSLGSISQLCYRSLLVGEPFHHLPGGQEMTDGAHVTASMIRRAALIFLPLALIAGGVLYLLYAEQVSAARKITAANQAALVEIARQRTVAAAVSVKADIIYLAGADVLRRWLAADTPETRKAIAGDYMVFARSKGLYDQVRLIDLQGQEVVRINNLGTGYEIVPEDRLQNKADRYYVRKTLRLDPGGIYMSSLDLNIEGKTVEQPWKPTIRFGTPVFDGDGNERGMIVLNYLGQRILDRIEALGRQGGNDMWLVNEEGYWLLGPRREEEWSFMFPGQPQHSFAQDYPAAWQKVRAGGDDSRQFSSNGDFFTVTSISPDVILSSAGVGTDVIDAPNWHIVSHIPAAAIAAQSVSARRYYTYGGITLTLLLAGGALGIAHFQAKRQQAELQLRAREAQFRTLLESAPDAVVVTDKAGRIVLVNAQTEQLFGYRRDMLVGQDIEILVPQRLRASHVEHRGRYIANPLPRSMGAGLELHGRRQDGTEFPVAISLSPAGTDLGLMIFCDIRDVTQQREAERKIAELNDRLRNDNAALEALNKELEAFSYSVSHDLRAPLRAIDGFSQALVEDYTDRLDEDGQQYLDRVRQAAQRMDRLIDDMLDLARVARSDMTRRAVDLTEMVQDILRRLAGDKVDRREAPVELVVDKMPPVSADPRLIRIALENLLGNAWKFTRKRANPRIEFGQLQQDGLSVYYVRDNGAGFDMAYAGKLFGAFQRLHDVRDFPGSGIGLATVQRVISKHGGRIWAEAEVDKGATFYFTL